MDTISAEELLARGAPDRAETAERLRAFVKHVVPGVVERVRAGWGIIGYDVPTGRRTTFFAWVWPQPEHVHIGFVHGAAIHDPDRVMKGAGVTKDARWLTYLRPEEIDEAVLEPLLLAAVRVASLSRAERVALILHREDAG